MIDWVDDGEAVAAGLTHVHVGIPVPDGWTPDDVWGWLAQGFEIPGAPGVDSDPAVEVDGFTWANFYTTPDAECDLCAVGMIPEHAWEMIEEWLSDDADPSGSR